MFSTSVVLVTLGNWTVYRKGHSELFTVTDHQVMTDCWIWLISAPCVTDSYRIWLFLCTRIRTFVQNTSPTFSKGQTSNINWETRNLPYLELIVLHMGSILLDILALSYVLLPKNVRDLPTSYVFRQCIRKLDLNSLLADAYCLNCILCSTW